MLTISPEIVDAFARAERGKFLLRLDAWLVSVDHQWRDSSADVRRHQLQLMLSEASACGFERERDLAVFAWTCMMLRSGWQAQLSDPALRDTLRSDQFGPEAKLLHLAERCGLERE